MKVYYVNTIMATKKCLPGQRFSFIKFIIAACAPNQSVKSRWTAFDPGRDG